MDFIIMKYTVRSNKHLLIYAKKENFQKLENCSVKIVFNIWNVLGVIVL